MALNGCLGGTGSNHRRSRHAIAQGRTIIGGLGGALVVASIVTLDKMKFDDPVGAVSVHGVVGLLGLLLAVPFTNSDASISGQLIGAATIFGWVFLTSFTRLSRYRDCHASPSIRGRGVRRIRYC